MGFILVLMFSRKEIPHFAVCPTADGITNTV